MAALKPKITGTNEPVMPSGMKIALNDLRKFAVGKLTQRLLWDSYYSALREPKIESDVPINRKVNNYVAAELIRNELDLINLTIDVNDYRQWKSKAEYQKFWLYYLKFAVMGRNLPEKSLEHYLAAKLLDFSEKDVYIDVGSSGSPTAEIYQKMYGCETYMQDLVFPQGMNGKLIGGDAGNMPVEDGFASKIALHCSFEHFEGDSDTAFIKEAGRVLRSGGNLCILPLYFFTRYAIQTDPTVLPRGTKQFENDALLFCSRSNWRNRQRRFYDVSHFISRIINNMDCLRLTLFMVQNEKQIDPSCYVKFIALFVKK
jgi:SAM-dependent methyltransferase